MHSWPVKWPLLRRIELIAIPLSIAIDIRLNWLARDSSAEALREQGHEASRLIRPATQPRLRGLSQPGRSSAEKTCSGTQSAGLLDSGAEEAAAVDSPRRSFDRRQALDAGTQARAATEPRRGHASFGQCAQQTSPPAKGLCRRIGHRLLRRPRRRGADRRKLSRKRFPRSHSRASGRRNRPARRTLEPES